MTTGSSITAYTNPNMVNAWLGSMVGGHDDLSVDVSVDSGTEALAVLEDIVDVLQGNVSDWNNAIDQAKRFVNADGWVLDLLVDRGQWMEKIGNLRSELNADIIQGNNTITQCEKYYDYDNEHYDFVISSLKDWGLKGAALAIEKCQIPSFLNMPLNAMASLGAGARCLIEMLNNDSLTKDLGVQMALEQEYANSEAITMASIKMPPILPALQFEAINLLFNKLLLIKEGMENLVVMTKYKPELIEEGINAAKEGLA